MLNEKLLVGGGGGDDPTLTIQQTGTLGNMVGLQLYVRLANGEQFLQSGVFNQPVIFKYSELDRDCLESKGVFKFITGGRQSEFQIRETVNIASGYLGDDVAYSPDDLTKDSLFVFEYYRADHSGGAN